jgi:uncharacterized protein (PEP-CTERM system associated)
MDKGRRDARAWWEAWSGNQDVPRQLKQFLSMSAALPAMLSCSAWAAQWDIIPTLSVGETYTDNLSLAPDASKQSDWVTQVIPGIAVAATGARLQFDANYAPEINYHARERQNNQTYQRLKATGSAEISEQILFVDAEVDIDQYNISLQGPITLSNVNVTGNVATVGAFSVSPYIRHDFGSNFRSEARIRYSTVHSDAPSTFSESTAERIDLRLQSGPAYKLLTWDLDYTREVINYDVQEGLIHVATARARRLITPSIGLLARGGYEYYESGASAPASKGPLWSAGVEWTPTPRTRVSASAGERLDDQTYYFDLRHRTRLTTWSAAYSEEITSTRSEFFVPVADTAAYLNALFLSQFPDPVERDEAVDEFVARTGLAPNLGTPTNFFSNELFVLKRWQASAGLLGARNALIANVFEETRERLSGASLAPGTGDFAASNNIKQTGASLQWNWRMTAQNSWNLRGAYSRDEFPDIGRIDDLITLGLGLTRQFQPRLSGAVNYRRQQNDSNQSAFSYTENAIFATLVMRF